MNFEQLHDIISEKSPSLILSTLKGLYNKTLSTTPQNENEATFASKIEKEECMIDWENKSCQEIHNLVRGIYKTPSAYFIFEDKKIKVLETKITNCESDCKCGDIAKIDKEGVTIKTKDGGIKLIRIKPEGKNEMPATAWSNGVKRR